MTELLIFGFIILGVGGLIYGSLYIVKRLNVLRDREDEQRDAELVLDIKKATEEIRQTKKEWDTPSASLHLNYDVDSTNLFLQYARQIEKERKNERNGN